MFRVPAMIGFLSEYVVERQSASAADSLSCAAPISLIRLYEIDILIYAFDPMRHIIHE